LSYKSQSAGASQVLANMEEHGCHPDEVTYNILTIGFLCNNEVTQALQLIDVMTGRSFSPDADTTSCCLAYFQMNKRRSQGRNGSEIIRNISFILMSLFGEGFSFFLKEGMGVAVCTVSLQVWCMHTSCFKMLS